MPGPISGSFFVLLLYDVSDEIRLEQLRGILRSPPGGRKPPFDIPHPSTFSPPGRRWLSRATGRRGRRATERAAALLITNTVSSAWNWNFRSKAVGRT